MAVAQLSSATVLHLTIFRQAFPIGDEARELIPHMIASDEIIFLA